MGKDLTTIPIQGYEEYYTISENGDIHRIANTNKYHEVFKMETPKLCGKVMVNGSVKVCLSLNGKSKVVMLNRLVYSHFNGGLKRNQLVLHKDGDIHNCHTDNLYLQMMNKK